MVNLRHLSSLIAIAEHGTFSAAGTAVGRSHSAISLHIKALEDELGTQLVDRSVRPPVLTTDGEALADHARRLDRVMEDINAIGRSDRVVGRLAVGIVPSVMAHLAPAALAALRRDHPDMQLSIRNGLSGELAQSVRNNDLDAAILTDPDLPPEDLDLRPICAEPLVVIAPAQTEQRPDHELLAIHPFIWFSRKTWAGQQIERRLLDRGIRVRAAIEVDSLEAIDQLVRHGLGVSIVPDRDVSGLCRVPFCTPQATRRVVMAVRPRTAKARLVDALHSAFVDLNA